MLPYVVLTSTFSLIVAGQLFDGFESSLRRIILCKDGAPVNFNCSDNRVISIEKTESGNKQCSSNNRNCNSKLFDKVNNLCYGKVTCDVPSDIFPSVCSRFPRYLKSKIDCSTWWRSTKERSISICSNLLSSVKCPSVSRHIHVKRVDIESDNSECDRNTDNSCVLQRMKHLCNEKKACVRETDGKSCMFEPMFVHIFYTCKVNVTQPSSNISDVTESTSRPSTTRENGILEMSTEFSQDDSGIALKKDADGRLLVNGPQWDYPRVVCIDNWDNNDATVACKLLRLVTSYTKAIILPNPDNYSVLNISLTCTGQEMSYLDCNYTEKQCSSTKAAGILCCDDDVSCGETSSKITVLPPSQVNNNDESTKTGLALGISLAVIVTVVIMFVLVYFRRRGSIIYPCIDRFKKPAPSINICGDDSVSQQGTVLPESSPRKTTDYQIQYNKEYDALYANRMQSEYSSDIQLYSIASNEDDQSEYVTSQVGVYDKTHERRHITNDVNLYEHSVDTVYDTANNKKREMYVDNTYGRTVNNVYDGHRKADDRVDYGYSRIVETAYDVSGYSKKRNDDTYDHT